MGDEDRYVTDDDLKQMPYLEMVFKEVLRLFPIGAAIQRTINEDIAISKLIKTRFNKTIFPKIFLL